MIPLFASTLSESEQCPSWAHFRHYNTSMVFIVALCANRWALWGWNGLEIIRDLSWDIGYKGIKHVAWFLEEMILIDLVGDYIKDLFDKHAGNEIVNMLNMGKSGCSVNMFKKITIVRSGKGLRE